MDIVTETKAEFRLRQWTKIIQECQASNLTVIARCSQHKIRIKAYSCNKTRDCAFAA
jgi:hypothetical protein